MNSIFLDILIGLLLLLSLIGGYRKGFFLTLCGILALFVSLIGAALISNALAQPMADLLLPAVEEGLRNTVGSYYQFTPAEGDLSQLKEFFETLEISQAVEALQDSALYQGAAQAFQQAADAGVAQVAADAVGSLAQYAALQIARIILFLLAFFTIQLVWYLASHTLNLAFRLPVLSTLNRWAGAILGLVKGLVLAWVLCRLLSGLIPEELAAGSVLLPLLLAGPSFLSSLKFSI